MTRIRAVAFDLDGLMFDTESLFFRVASEMLSARGKIFTREIMAAMIGRQAAIAYPAMKVMAGLEESTDALLAEARERFFALIDSAVHTTPGLFSLLDHLETLGLPRAVCTSSRRAYAERLLGNHGLADHFAFLLCAEDVTRSKPDPEIYQTAAARFGIDPSELMVLEDSPAGLSAAKASGSFAVAIPHEHSPEDALRGADLIASRLDDPAVLAILDRARNAG
jgi:HAD superfamily hydrolase (TIGR01509 family)